MSSRDRKTEEMGENIGNREGTRKVEDRLNKETKPEKKNRITCCFFPSKN